MSILTRTAANPASKGVLPRHLKHFLYAYSIYQVQICSPNRVVTLEVLTAGVEPVFN